MPAMISTEDNPFDPRTHYPSWYAWDVAQGYNTCAYLARVAALPDEMPETVVDFYVEQAIDEIIAQHDGGIYIKLPLLTAA